jgi:predicted AlkP superfamily phosphohydrolase/phosphomutase
MKHRPTRALVIGIDGLMPEMVEKFTAEGHMPNLARLMQDGVYSPMLSSPPVDTPTNWTSLSTGAWTGTHGINTFGVHRDGERFEEMRRVNPSIFPEFVDQAPVYMSDLCRAEYIWQAAERAGKRCILVNWPGGWPATSESLVAIDGSGPYSSILARLSTPHTYAAHGGDATVPLILRQATALSKEGIQDRSSRPMLESALVISGEGILQPDGDGWRAEGAGELDSALFYRLEVVASSVDGYDRVTVYRGLSSDEPLTTLAVGEWSPWLWEKLPTRFGQVGAKFRLRLQHLAADGSDLVLYRTALFNTHGWAYPSSVADELIEDLFIRGQAQNRAGLLETDGSTHDIHPIVPLCQVYESISDQARGLALATRYLATHHLWDLLMVQVHAPDGLHHEALNGISPHWKRYDPCEAERYWDRFRAEYHVLDRMVGEIVDACADEDTLVLVVSDHAAIPTTRTVWVGQALVDAGLLVYRENEDRQWVMDWEHTKVVLGDHPLAENVWVNLKGRDPHGIVEPGKEYETLREAIIQAFYALRDPETGQCPVALALRKEDASFMGQWGDTVGDIVYYLTPGYASSGSICSLGPIDPQAVARQHFKWIEAGIESKYYAAMHGIHHQYLPNAEYGGCSNRAVFVMAGPGVRKRQRLPVPPWTPDVVPTLTHLLGIPAPAQAEGKIIAAALEEL